MKARMTAPFVLASMGGAALSVAFAALLRGGMFVRFVGVLLAIQTFAVVSLAPGFHGPLLWIMAWAQAASFVHIVSLLRPELRDWKWRALISWPGQWFVAGSFACLSRGPSPRGFPVSRSRRGRRGGRMVDSRTCSRWSASSSRAAM
jgi:hypothetical protein